MCVIYIVFGDVLLEYGFDFINLGRDLKARESIHTFTGRTEIWEVCLKYFFEEPILGYGYNTFLTPKMTIIISQEVGWVPGSPHSGYLDLALGLGIIGLINFLIILIYAIALSLKHIKLNIYTAYTASILIWLAFNLITEALILSRPIYPNFIWMILVSKTAFLNLNIRKPA
jgi:O-antigen ligase